MLEQDGAAESPDSTTRPVVADLEDRDFHLSSLTGLRAFAAWWVVLFHLIPAVPGWTLVLPFSSLGYLGVDLFFALSGFIICHRYLSVMGQRFSFRRTREFLWLRLARIYPVHVFTLFLLITLRLILGAIGIETGTAGDFGPVSLLANLSLVHAWFGQGLSWNYPAWSISVEWLAYLVFPILVLGLFRIKRSRFAVPGALAAAAIAYVPLLAAETMTGSAAGPSMPASPVLHIAAGFVGGAAGYIVASHIAANASIRGRMLPRWVTPALWFVLLMGMTIASNEVDGWNSVVVTPAFALAIAVTAFPRTRLGILSSRSMVHLGITSYSLYMTHAIVLFVMSGYSGSSGLLEIFGLSNSGPISTFYALLQLLLCGIVGYGTWRLIEEPSRRAMRRVAVRVDRVLPVEER